jgi:NAD-dependent deacetylase
VEFINNATMALKDSKFAVVFTGAGISVESGIAPFRGENGILGKYDEKFFEINYFYFHTKEVWKMLCNGFYKAILKSNPNIAHVVLARLEQSGIIKAVITQNIDNLHTKAGSKNVYELHGNASKLICLHDGNKYSAQDFDLKTTPCCKKCKTVLKPDFVFFGEMLPEKDMRMSVEASKNCDVMLVIGSTGIVYPAASLPVDAKRNGATIIEINPKSSAFTKEITDIFIPMEAVKAMVQIWSLF